MTAYAHEAEEWRDALRDAPPIDKPSRSDAGDEDRARANQDRKQGT